MDATVELLQVLIRNRCVNDGTPSSGEESRNADVLHEGLVITIEPFLTTVALRTYAAQLGPAFIHEVATRLREPALHWVRLEIVARLSDAAPAG